MSLPISDNIQHNAPARLSSRVLNKLSDSFVLMLDLYLFVLFTFLNQEKLQRFSGFLPREKLKYPDDQITKVKNLKSREIDCFPILSVVLSINLSIYLEIYSVANQSSDKGKLKINQFHINKVKCFSKRCMRGFLSSKYESYLLFPKYRLFLINLTLLEECIIYLKC